MTHNEQIQRRRTFAIISHPDAGKTTLTEKLLLYGGALNLAGSVTARKKQQATTSDWMELEKQRGISVSSTVLQFEYRNAVVNLLDTPGHKDFSEDTYRVLTAVDAVVMVIDAGKGIESQTRKLFEVCRLRGIPIFTFMNKLDRPAKDPIFLMDELEQVLGIGACALNWPIGTGHEFRGIYDRRNQQVHLFERTSGGTHRAPVQVGSLQDDFVKENTETEALARAIEQLGMLEGAGHTFDRAAVDRGELTPVFFGSASNNFGVQLLLDTFLELSPPPVGRVSQEMRVEPDADYFSGFVFKIQANMDPCHRDRMSFIRIVSGCFQRDMQVIHNRTGKKVRLANSQRLFGQDRETVNEAFAGDVIGIVGNYDFQIGDTLSDRTEIRFDEIPRFVPECFAYLHNPSPSKFKRFREGLGQLLKEGVVQVFSMPHTASRIPLLGAVGMLQFEVVQYRLESEYGAEARIEITPWKIIRWLRPLSAESPEKIKLPTGVELAFDEKNCQVALFPEQWLLKIFGSNNPQWEISQTPFDSKNLSPKT